MYFAPTLPGLFHLHSFLFLWIKAACVTRVKSVKYTPSADFYIAFALAIIIYFFLYFLDEK